MYGSNTCRSYWFYHQASFILQRYVGFKKTPQHQLSQDAFYILAAAERSDVLLGYDKNCIWRYCRLLQGQGESEWTEWNCQKFTDSSALHTNIEYIGSKSTMYKQDILSLSFTPPIFWAEFRKLNLQSLSHNLCIQIQTNLVCLRTFQETF